MSLDAIEDKGITSTILMSIDNMSFNNHIGKLKIIIPDEIADELNLSAGDEIKWLVVVDVNGNKVGVVIKKT